MRIMPSPRELGSVLPGAVEPLDAGNIEFKSPQVLPEAEVEAGDFALLFSAACI